MTGPRIVEIAATDALHDGELDLRFRVLRAPLGMARATVGFAGEADAAHFVAVDAGDRVVGCAVLVPTAPGEARLRAMAVEPPLHGRGIGAAIVRALEDGARARGIRILTLHAREGAVGFYAKLGYTVEGAPFVEVGLPHRAMRKALP